MRLIFLTIFAISSASFCPLSIAAPARSKSQCFLDEMRVLFNTSDLAKDSMETMIKKLKQSQGVNVVFDDHLKFKTTEGKYVASRNEIVLASKALNEANKVALLHESVHATTYYRLRTAPSIENCARSISFVGYIPNAPAGYRTYFSVDEILAFEKMSIYEKQLSNNPDVAVLRRRMMKSASLEHKAVSQALSLNTSSMLDRLDEITLKYNFSQSEKTRFVTKPHPNVKDLVEVHLKLGDEAMPLTVIIPIPVSRAELKAGLDPTIILERSRAVLLQARAQVADQAKNAAR